ncbi:formimidoylglutamase [Sphingobacterium rhinopitheci]|uniref:formimidoylglutamase n=1 Tax=Sphingobacterium rhinopitheci TaxID=2781960 RepID=UPI001F52A765|nr:formimidoylglutamase [Sphingobacterium rhinopitheci]MCI0922455.1 formimidoylglutamase [Sphingobacterium rhinopitheci]
MGLFDYKNYQVAKRENWCGRMDGLEREEMRWHQVVQLVDLRKDTFFTNAVVIVGFCCDIGVQRNLGRIGAKDGPSSLRKIVANLPVYFSNNIVVMDAGDIGCNGDDLEQAQFVLSEAVAKIISGGGFPIVLGGGHEVTYGHYLGIKKGISGGSIGIINIDAHLDIRTTVQGLGNSGTGFYQIAQDSQMEGDDFQYLAIGIQDISNTRALINYALSKDVNIIYADEVRADYLERIKIIITAFAQQVDHIYLTVDMDAFAAPYAPGVSALAYNGIIPDHVFFAIYSTIIHLPNLRTVDIAELNPSYDIDNRTARLGSSLIFALLKERFFNSHDLYG